MSSAKPPIKLTFLLPLAAFVILALVAAVALLGTMQGTRNQTALPSVLIGKKAPDLPANALSVALAKPLSDFQGQPVLVNIMASWCAPCRAEIPALAMIAEDIPVIAIAYKDKQEDTTNFLAQYGNPFEAVWMDYDGTNGIKWGIYGVPESFLLDANGQVVLRHAGPIFKDVITDVINPALEALEK